MNILNELKIRHALYSEKREELCLQTYSLESALCLHHIDDVLFILSNEIDSIIYETPQFFSNRLDSIKAFEDFDNMFSWLLD